MGVEIYRIHKILDVDQGIEVYSCLWKMGKGHMLVFRVVVKKGLQIIGPVILVQI